MKCDTIIKVLAIYYERPENENQAIYPEGSIFYLDLEENFEGTDRKKYNQGKKCFSSMQGFMLAFLR